MSDSAINVEDAVVLNGSSAGGKGGLFHQAVETATHLITAEIQLAKDEITDSVRAAVMALLGGAIAVFALIAFLVMTIVTVVAAVPLHWVAALSFAALFLALGAGSALFAMRRLKDISPLQQTIETVKEDLEWAKQQLTNDAK